MAAAFAAAVAAFEQVGGGENEQATLGVHVAGLAGGHGGVVSRLACPRLLCVVGGVAHAQAIVGPSGPPGGVVEPSRRAWLLRGP